MTSPISSSTETTVAAAFIHVQPHANHIASGWMLPEVRRWLENVVSNQMGGGDDVGRTTNDACQAPRQRSPLTILYGSSLTQPARPQPSDSVAVAAPWRPFSVHEDRPASAAPSSSTTATNDDPRSASVVDDIHPQHHAAGQRRTSVDFLAGVPLARADLLNTDWFHRQRLLSSVVDVGGGLVYPVVVTARQQCSQCGAVFTTLTDLTRYN